MVTTRNQIVDGLHPKNKLIIEDLEKSSWLKQLKPHQINGVNAILSQDGFAALYAQRSGKTWCTGAMLEVEKETTHDVILVGPLTNLRSTWLKFLSEKLPWYSVHFKLDSYVADKKSGKSSHRILLLNYEAVTPILPKLRKIKWDRAIYDEAQRLKNRTSRSSRDAGLLARSARKRLALTGTPMDLDPKDLWAIMRFVEPDALGTVWKDFKDYFLVKPTIDLKKARGEMQRRRMILAHQIATRKAPMRKDRSDEFADIISPHVMRISKEDAGIDPARVHYVRFDLDAHEDKVYRSLEKSMIVKHKGMVIKTPLKIVQIGKLQQVTGGYIKDEDGEVHTVGTSKRRLLRRMIAEHANDQPFVVFCKYVWEVHMIHRILTRLGRGDGAKLWGKVKDIKRDPRRTNMLLGFQSGKYPWIVCQQRTGGVGVDLYYARKAFVFSLTHSYIDYDQMLSRLDFLDQNDAADFFILMARSSIDIDIISAVKRKRSISEQFYDRLI